MMIFRQSSLAAEPQNRRVRDAEFAQDRGDILAAGKKRIAETKPVDDTFKYQRIYPDGELYAPITGYYSYDHGRTALENSYNSSAGRHRRCAVRAPAHRPGHQPDAGGGQRADHDRAQGAEGGGRRAREPEGGRRRARPSHRRRAGPGDQPELRPEPDRQPRHRRRRQGLPPTRRRPRSAAVQPRGAGDLPARVHLQAGDRGGGTGRRHDPGDQGRVAGPAETARTPPCSCPTPVHAAATR